MQSNIFWYMKHYVKFQLQCLTKFYWNTTMLFLLLLSSFTFMAAFMLIAAVELHQRPFGMQSLEHLLFGPSQRKSLNPGLRHGPGTWHPKFCILAFLSLVPLTSSWGKEHHWNHLSANIQQNLRNRSLTASKIFFLPVEWRSGFKKHFMRACSIAPKSHVQLFVTPWTVTQQAPLILGFPRQE